MHPLAYSFSGTGNSSLRLAALRTISVKKPILAVLENVCGLKVFMTGVFQRLTKFVAGDYKVVVVPGPWSWIDTCSRMAGCLFFYVSLNSSPAKLEFDAVVLGAATRRPRLWFLLIRKDSLRVDDAAAAVSEFFPKLVKAGAALPEKTSNLDQGRLLQSNFAAGST